MWICPISSPYFSGTWSWTKYKCISDHTSSFVTRPMDCHGGTRLYFVLAGLIIAILVEHERFISVTVGRL